MDGACLALVTTSPNIRTSVSKFSIFVVSLFKKSFGMD